MQEATGMPLEKGLFIWYVFEPLRTRGTRCRRKIQVLCLQSWVSFSLFIVTLRFRRILGRLNLLLWKRKQKDG